MAGRLTPHVLVAGSALLVTVVCTLPTLVLGGGSWSVPTKELRIVGPAAETDVVSSDIATKALIEDLAHPPDVDPFNPRQPSFANGPAAATTAAAGAAAAAHPPRSGAMR